LAPREAAQAAAAAYHFDDSPYKARVYQGYNAPKSETALRLGPNITDWPPMEALGEHLLVQIAAFITDPITTTDELIPSGETSSYRSNPVGLANFTLSRKDPAYVGRARKIAEAETARQLTVEQGAALPSGKLNNFPKVSLVPEMPALIAEIRKLPGFETLDLRELRIGSSLYAVKPGDGSAREQAASCQKVLGGWANFAREYATKRYRSNLINWGIVPFVMEQEPEFAIGDFVFIPALRSAIIKDESSITAYVIRPLQISPDTNEIIFMVTMFPLAGTTLSDSEKAALLAGSLINLNRKTNG
jgi:aconitate hydratase